MTPDARLRFHLGPEGGVWHFRAAAANHVLIDPQARSRALAPGFVRPIELWRAPRWQRPPSAAVVRYADSDQADRLSGRPDLGEVVNLATVVDFVGDVSAFRLGTLGALIDAVAAASAGGRPVVLAAGADPDEVAMWIAAVSFFAPPALCLQISFSTYERLDDVLAQAGQPAAAARTVALISAVPAADLERLNRRDDLPVVVIDPRVEATLRAIGGTEHRITHLGQQIAVTDWSRLALDACCEDFTVLERCLARIDEVSLASPAPGVPGEWWPADLLGPARRAAAGPAWPLAAAIVLTGGLPLALPTATRVLLRDTPGSLRLPSELAGSVASLVLATVDDAEQAWARLQSAQSAQSAQSGQVNSAEPVNDALVQAAFESYLRLALADDSWLLRPAPPLPAVPIGDLSLVARLHGPLAALVERLDPPPADAPAPEPAAVRRGVLLLRAVDFAHRLSRLLGGPDLAVVGVGRLAVIAVRLLLAEDTGERIAQLVGPLDAEALARWIVGPLSREAGWQQEPAGAAVGDRLPAPLLALLAGALDVEALLALPHPEGLSGQPVALEVAVAVATGRIAGDPRLRAPAVEHLLHRAAEAYPDADPAAMVAEVFDRVPAGPGWPAASLLRIVEHAPSSLAAYLVPVALAQLPDWIDDPTSGRLAAALLQRVEFLPRRGGDGRPRPRRAGTRDEEAQLLNLLAATGEGWLSLDEGLHRRAAEILMWADRAWPWADLRVRQLIAARIVVAAFQVALAAEPAQAGTVLRSRLGVVPIGSSWRAALPLGLEPALPMVGQVLGLNRYRLAGELATASTGALVLEPRASTEPRLPGLPVGPVLRWLVTHEPSGRLAPHLAALVDQELADQGRSEPGPLHHSDPVELARIVDFWEHALPGITLRASAAGAGAAGPARPAQAAGVLAVALGSAAGLRAGERSALRSGPLAQLMARPGERSWEARHLALPGRPRRSLWRRWQDWRAGR